MKNKIAKLKFLYYTFNWRRTLLYAVFATLMTNSFMRTYSGRDINVVWNMLTFLGSPYWFGLLALFLFWFIVFEEAEIHS